MKVARAAPTGAGTEAHSHPSGEDFYISRAEEQLLCDRVRRHWLDQGYRIAIEVVKRSGKGDVPVWGLRSDMVNGFPRDYPIWRNTSYKAEMPPRASGATEV